MNRIITKQITTQVGSIRIPGLCCLPEESGPFSAVIVLHGSDGFQTNHRDIAERLAQAGLAAFAPTWFGGDPARPHWDHLRAEDLLMSVADFQNQTNIPPDRTGLIGFSRGGGLALILGSLLPGTKAIVNYFGLTAWKGGLEELPLLPLNKDNPLEFVRHLTCPILSFHGDQDTVVPVNNTYALDEACHRYGVEHRYIVYPGINHSFIWEGEDKHDADAHCDSWNKTIAFLKERLL